MRFAQNLPRRRQSPNFATGMEAAASTHVILEDTSRRERAKERLYVLFQTLGWGAFLGMQILSSKYFSIRDDGTRDAVISDSSLVMTVTLGLLLTHYVRPFITRWNWKQLGWRPLVPRVFAASALMSMIWVVVGFGYFYVVLRCPWPSTKFTPALAIFFTWLNSIFLFVCWFCLYFFYHLFDRFNRSEIERLRLAGTAKESELRALKSQVNPHFIFNSLNSLRALIDEDPPRARLAVTQLSNLLRYSLQSGQLETVPFEDELRVVSDYLALEQVRHEERLRVRLDIAPETLALPVPPMLLQTLVENAVKYGIATRPEGGEVAIVARCVGGALSIQVTNPGSLGAPGAPVRPSSTGVGLRNAAERLRILFGERATLQLRAQAPALVVAEAVLPLPPGHHA